MCAPLPFTSTRPRSFSKWRPPGVRSLYVASDTCARIKFASDWERKKLVRRLKYLRAARKNSK